MAFKVKTTAPKKYCVKPNTGFVQAGATQVVHVIMQAQREWPADINACKDKFLVQSCPSGGSTDFTELFAKGKEGIGESKLRVSYAQPAPPPSPVPEGEEGDGKESTDAPSASVSQMYSSKSTEVASKPMPSDVAGLRRELERYRIKNDGLTADLNAALRSNKNGGVARGFSLLHLLITGASRPTRPEKKPKKTEPTFLPFHAYPSLPLVLVADDSRAARRLGFLFIFFHRGVRVRPAADATSSPFSRPFGEPTPSLPLHRRDSFPVLRLRARVREVRGQPALSRRRAIPRAAAAAAAASAKRMLMRPRSPPSPRSRRSTQPSSRSSSGTTREREIHTRGVEWRWTFDSKTATPRAERFLRFRVF